MCGGTIPVVIQSTKRGEIFMLDRRDGTPVAEVEERPVPKPDGTAKGEVYSGYRKLNAPSLTLCHWAAVA